MLIWRSLLTWQAILPKFTVENRLPIGIQFRLSVPSDSVPRTAERTQTTISERISPPVTASPAPAPPPLVHVPTMPSVVGSEQPPARAPFSFDAAEFCVKLREQAREAVASSPCGAAIAASRCGAVLLGDVANKSLLGEAAMVAAGDTTQPAGEAAKGRSEPADPAPASLPSQSVLHPAVDSGTGVGTTREARRETVVSFGEESEPSTHEEELIDGLPIGEHCEVLCKCRRVRIHLAVAPAKGNPKP